MSGYMAPSKTVEWSTPQDLFDSLNAEFNFTVDVAADSSNAKCAKYYTQEIDGLAQDWSGEVVWCNPPYGVEIAKWAKKAYETITSSPNTVIVLLIPVRSDTRWFHDYILDKAEIRFIRGRLKFGGCKTAAPFPNMVVVYKST